MIESHLCDPDRCTCPIHETPMFYSRHENLHACQDPECKYAHGYENVLVAEFWVTRGIGV